MMIVNDDFTAFATEYECNEQINALADKFIKYATNESHILCNAVLCNIGVRDSKETLPNIVFDITGNDIIDFQQIIENVKPLGYKISVVWALGDFEQIIKQNVQIDRRVSHSIIIDKLWDEWYISGEILLDKVMLKSIDEFWVILQSVFDPNDPDDIFRHQSLAYVYQITGTNDLADLMSIVRHMVNDQISKLAEKFK